MKFWNIVTIQADTISLATFSRPYEIFFLDFAQTLFYIYYRWFFQGSRYILFLEHPIDKILIMQNIFSFQSGKIMLWFFVCFIFLINCLIIGGPEFAA